MTASLENKGRRSKITPPISSTIRDAASKGETLRAICTLIRRKHRVALAPSTVARHLAKSSTWTAPTAAPEDGDDPDTWDSWWAEVAYVDSGARVEEALVALTPAERKRTPPALLAAVEALVAALNATIPPEEREVPSCAG